MKKTVHWRKLLTCLSVLCSISTATAAAITPASAASGSDPVREVNRTARYLAQRGECRETRRDTFVYRSPNDGRPISSLRRGETVTLAEDRPDRQGWIAVSQPTVGFVEERLLARCGTAISPEFPGTGVRPGVAQLCVNDRAGREGLRIYESPSARARVVDRAFQEERLRVDTTDIQRNPSGQVWFRITFPVNGWVSYGFPNEGLINLENCELLRLRSSLR